ncbi:MAG TPA: hypothetical protein VK738_18390 [Terriglobales bacterium]|nr:hypothetical protein [Terriglobales bacterium]
MKPLFFLVCLAITAPLASAAVRNCSGGSGEYSQQLPGGYVAQLSPATDDAHAGQCHATITSSDQKSVFEAYGYEMEVNQVSGKDINADDKPDAVIESHPKKDECCWNYYIVSLGDPPGLLRQITTSVPLTFEDRLGDGKVEIWGRDNAFDGVENFAHADSPTPLVFFRMKGANIYNVSNLFWDDYQREITQARDGLPRSVVEDMVKVEGDDSNKPGGGHGGGGGGSGDPRDPKEIQLLRAKAAILEIALNYLYGGRGQDAWKTISEMWPPLDRPRIRQVILETRMKGLLSEINRQPKASTP